ncbi:MAG TPA: ATP-binding protein [Terracidiphilus sp.]|nr:ATP-binding protein [Terracidiphilus sp.]
MSESGQPMEIEPILLKEVGDALFHTRPFSGTSPDAVTGVERVDRVKAPAGTTLLSPGDEFRYYWLLLEGESRAERPESDGSLTLVGIAHAGEAFGEVPFLTGKTHSPFLISTTKDSVLLRFTEDEFWSLLACCPSVRKVVMADMAVRHQAYQTEALHREKLVSLGTLAAGLMHELHNPGSAAKRAASQLRENLLRLQQMSLRNAAKQKTKEQLECMRDLLLHALGGCRMAAMSSLDQADAEEAMGEWLAEAGVENAFSIAPALVEIGFKQEELACARDAFDAPSFSDALNWLEALVSSVALVCAIEESISRVSELVMAVKKFAYDERTPGKELDVHDSLQSTITILGHKLRTKNLSIQKKFEASPSIIKTRGSALSQVWTNLIDNAMDASPTGGVINISTWTEPGWLAVCIEDHGTGIPPEVLPHIWEAFFTTKPQGSGTGLGLEIVHRIITQKFGGTIEVKSEPGDTKFIVRLPAKEAAAAAN